MSVASKPIAGQSPIAAGGTYVPPMVVQFWGPTSVVYEPVSEAEFQVQFWGPTSVVYDQSILLDPEAGEGECITACPHVNIAYAYPLDDSVSVNPLQQCREEAA